MLLLAFLPSAGDELNSEDEDDEDEDTKEDEEDK